MNKVLYIAGILSLSMTFTGCKEKDKKTDKEINFIPVISKVKEQIEHIDTSLYTIMKITKIDSTRNDTAYIERSRFAEAAHEFLSVPDISSKELRDRYQEQNQYDETLGRFLITYEALNPDKDEVQREELLVKPDPPDDKVTNIIIHTVRVTKDSSVEKRLLWNMDRSFQVITTKLFPGKPETTSTYSVVWNEKEDE